jgi:tryptophanyl-tRNA synthetase
MKRVLTGITTTGSPHIGNYVGAIRPAIQASHRADTESFYFLADYHALVKTGDAERVQRSTLEIAATWLALGLDPDKVFFYRQSDIPEIPELTWLLTCVTAKGLLNRAHAYKASVDANVAAGEDPDAGITAGLYMYPVLMAADILVFNAHAVPVGRDQIQHIEMARDIGQRFNHRYQHEYFTLPEAQIDESTAILPGLDGRKMSKSYDNTIPLWDEPKAMRKKIMGIVTNSLAPGEAKDPETSHLFTIYRAFATPAESQAMRQEFANGMGWGEIKDHLASRIEFELAEPRERYKALISEPRNIEQVLHEGAARARAIATPFLGRLRHAVGLRSLTDFNRVDHAAKRGSEDAKVLIKQFPEGVAPRKWFFRILAGKDLSLLSWGFAERGQMKSVLDAIATISPQTLHWWVVEDDGAWYVQVRGAQSGGQREYYARSGPCPSEQAASAQVEPLQELCRQAAEALAGD